MLRASIWVKAAALFLFCLSAGFLSAQNTDEPVISTEPLWRRALGGSISGYPAQGPGGDVYVVADDRALHSLDPETGESHWIYRPGGRLRNLLMVAPDGTVYVQNDRQELFAVTPGGTGRWKLNMKREPSALPAAAPDGRLVVPLTGGRIVGVSRHGRILWHVDESAEASAAPVVDGNGTAWVPLSDGRILAVDYLGESTTAASLGRGASMLALDGLGRLWVGGFNGRVSVLDIADFQSTGDAPKEHFSLRPSQSRVAALICDTGGGGRIFTADGSSVEVSPEGEELSRMRLSVSGGAPSAGAEGTLYLPSVDGSLKVIQPAGDELELRGGSVLAEPLLSSEGILIAGGGDWILYAWKASEPGKGWRQFRGNSRRSGTFPAPPPVLDRAEARKEAGFFFRERMAVSDDLSERLALLRELEGFPDSQNLHRELPWADLILEDLVAVGTIRLVDKNDQPLQSHGVARARGYALLAENEDFRSRSLLLECLSKEEDPAALAAGFRALGTIGTDWDGASMRLMARRYREMPSNSTERLTLETARALADLVRYNGNLSDPAGYDLMNALLQSPISQGGREEVIAIIRSVASL